MTEDPIGRLLSISVGPQAAGPLDGLPTSQLGHQLHELLSMRNGFIAFESALLVRGAGLGVGDAQAWNSPDGWRAEYGDLAEGLWFFAEDTFGGQFALDGDAVIYFEPETGERERLASSIEDWARHILSDWEVSTGQPLAHGWQSRFGPLPPGTRLCPVMPFVLGGEFSIDNLALVDDVQAMRTRGDLALQLRSLPEGAQVRYRLRGR